MARREYRTWPAGHLGPSRRDRQGCMYQIYVPDRLAGREFSFSGATAADLTEAETAIVKFNNEANSLADTEALARILLRTECVASSKIEGLDVGPRRILKAQAGLDLATGHRDVNAQEILANIQAMELAMKKISIGSPITVEILQEVNQLLLADTRLSAYGGQLRTEQNWIGGSDYNPCSADFVPPGPELVRDLLDDLAWFCNQDELPAVAQAAIAHSQFETIHPFADGNGRTGRVLIQMILRARGLSPRVAPPVSLVLSTQVKSYLQGLEATRYNGEPESIEAVDGINLWVGRFATVCKRAVQESLEFEETVKRIEQEWREILGAKRQGASINALIHGLVSIPILTTSTAMTITGTTRKATASAIDSLVDAGILKPIGVAQRNKAFEAHQIISAFSKLEGNLNMLEEN